LLACKEETAIKSGGLVCRDEDVPDGWARGGCDFAKNLRPRGNRTPHQNFAILGRESSFNLDVLSRLIVRKKEDSNTEGLVRGKLKPRICEKPRSRNNYRNADTVA